MGVGPPPSLGLCVPSCFWALQRWLFSTWAQGLLAASRGAQGVKGLLSAYGGSRPVDLVAPAAASAQPPRQAPQVPRRETSRAAVSLYLCLRLSRPF